MAETSTNLGRVSLVPRGEYDPTAQYQRLDIVRYSGSSYLVLHNLHGITPVDGTDYMLIAHAGENGAPGADGADGAPGNSIAGIERTAGTGAAGTTDTYTITMTDGSTYQFQVYNGADGTGAGDMTKSVYDPQGKNSDVFAYVDNGLVLKQPKLTGKPGQVVGFGSDGSAVPQDAPNQADAVTVPGGGVMELGPELGDGPYTFELTEDGEAAVSATQVSYDGAQSGLQAETVQGAVDELGAKAARVSNDSLLHNAYWAQKDYIINQKGQEEYTESGYTIDRWVSLGLTVTLEDGWIKLHNPGENAAHFVQLLELDTYKIVSAAQSVLSILYRCVDQGCGLYSGTVSLGGEFEVMHPFVPLLSQGNQPDLAVSGLAPSSAAEISQWQACVISVVPGATVWLKAAKLEEGPVQTLAHKEGDTWVLNDPPPDPALELARCQRYYQIFKAQSLRPTNAEDFRPPMRVTPVLGTIVIDGVTYYTADANL